MDEDLYSFADKDVLTGLNGPKDNKKADTERYLSDNIQEKPVKKQSAAVSAQNCCLYNKNIRFREKNQWKFAP